MANQSFVVIRLVPESPVDGATFSTYLDDLAIQVVDANTKTPLSGLAYASPMTVFQWFAGSGAYLSAVSAATAVSTPYKNASDYGSALKFKSTDGISVGAYVFSADQQTIP